jgi:hypothetical protein
VYCGVAEHGWKLVFNVISCSAVHTRWRVELAIYMQKKQKNMYDLECMVRTRIEHQCRLHLVCSVLHLAERERERERETMLTDIKVQFFFQQHSTFSI